MSNTDKLEIRIMDRLNEALREFSNKQDSRFDKLEKKIDSLENKFARKTRVDLLEKVVYGGVGLILTGVIIALLNLVIVK